MLGWLVACSTRVSDTVFAMMFRQIRSTLKILLQYNIFVQMILRAGEVTLLNLRPSTGICFMMSSELKMGSR